MKKKDLKELQGKTIAELKAVFNEKKAELVKLKLNLVSKKIKNVHTFREKRKELARILTLIREKELIKEE